MSKLLAATSVFGILLSATVLSQQDTDAAKTYALCAASNAILSTQMEAGMLHDVVTSEAKRHADLAKNYGAIESDLRQFIEAMMEAYNSGDISWNEISDIGQKCSEL